MSIGWNGVELRVIQEIQISRHMTIYGQTLGVFKRENIECIRNGEKTNLHEIISGAMTLRHEYLIVTS